MYLCTMYVRRTPLRKDIYKKESGSPHHPLHFRPELAHITRVGVLPVSQLCFLNVTHLLQ
jgi:hypothetical protein